MLIIYVYVSGEGHLHLKKWPPFRQTTFSRSPDDSKPALVQVMAWRRTGKPLPGQMITQFMDTSMLLSSEKKTRAHLI